MWNVADFLDISCCDDWTLESLGGVLEDWTPGFIEPSGLWSLCQWPHSSHSLHFDLALTSASCWGLYFFHFLAPFRNSALLARIDSRPVDALALSHCRRTEEIESYWIDDRSCWLLVFSVAPVFWGVPAAKIKICYWNLYCCWVIPWKPSMTQTACLQHENSAWLLKVTIGLAIASLGWQ